MASRGISKYFEKVFGIYLTSCTEWLVVEALVWPIECAICKKSFQKTFTIVMQ